MKRLKAIVERFYAIAKRFNAVVPTIKNAVWLWGILHPVLRTLWPVIVVWFWGL